MRRISSNSESGAILAIVIILMLALTITGIAFLNAGVMENRLVGREVYKNQAFYLADGGIEHLRVRLSVLGGHQEIRDKPVVGGGSDGDYQAAVDGRPDLKLALGEGGYWVEYYEASTPYAISIGEVIKGGNIVDIVDVGEVIQGGNLIVEKKIKVILKETPLFDYAVFGDEWIEVGGNSLIDSIDPFEIGKIGTNGTTPGAIEVAGSGLVNANVYVGANSDPNTVIVGIENITGPIKEALQQPIEWPAVVEPSGLTFVPTPLTILPSEDISISGGWEYPSIDIKGILRIPAGASCILLADTLTISGIGEIIIEAGASLEIYVRELAQLEGNNITNVDENPLSCQIYGIGEADIFFRGDTNFYGTMYAPDGDIICRGNAEITGSLIGNTIDISGNPKVLWDPILATGGPTRTSLRNWQEIF